MNKLTETVLNELRLSIFNENTENKILVLFPGRFQPFHINHKYAYDWLVDKFGMENVYIATTNSTDSKKSPFTFDEKKKIINKHGISNVIKVSRPYSPPDAFDALEGKFSPNDTTIVYAIGEKDANRLGSRATKFNKTTYIPAKDLENPYLYYIILPKPKFKLDDSTFISGTSSRNALTDPEAKLSELKERFKKIFGWFDSGIFNLVINKLNPSRANLKESISTGIQTFKNMTREQFRIFYNMMRKEYSDTKGMIPIIKKWANGETITQSEKVFFNKQLIDIAKLSGLGIIAVIPIPATTLLIPIIIKLGKRYGINVLPNDDVTEVIDKEFWKDVFTEVNKDIITEGGAYGHMSHIFEDPNITFAEIKDIFELGLSGRISVQSDAMEKTDGQNLMFTFKSNSLYAARNTTDIKRGGATLSEIENKFEGRGHIKDAFVFAIYDLQNACRKLSTAQKELIFKSGKCWMSCEVIYPSTLNVINYDGAKLIFHGAFEYNDNGEIISEHPEFERILAGMIKQVNANSQKTFSISGQFRPKIEQSKDFSTKLSYFNRRLDHIKNITGCKDTDTLSKWYERWWTAYIKKNIESKFGVLDPIIFNGLLNRWAHGEKKFLLNSSNIPDKDLLVWVKEFTVSKYPSIQTKNNRLFEDIILKFGAEVLTNVKTFISANPDKAVDDIKKNLEIAIRTLSSSTNPDDIRILKTQLSRIQAAGGLEKIVPSEGLVFRYKGKTYKITGLFAPINQILGALKYK